MWKPKTVVFRRLLLNDTEEGGIEIGDVVPSAPNKAVQGVRQALLARRTKHDMIANTMWGSLSQE